MKAISFWFVLSMFLSSCGMKGDLYLPEEGRDTVAKTEQAK